MINTEDKSKRFSYSSIDTFCTCPMRFDLTYNKGYRSEKTTLALGLGSIAHKCLELSILTKMGKEKYTIDELINILYKGWSDDEETIPGVEELEKLFFDDFIEGRYGVKLITFKDLLQKDFVDTEWTPIAVEQEFTFVYEDKCVFHGFIDRVDINSQGELRVVDYKTSKKTYDNDKLNHAMQMGVYKNACIDLYGKVPVEYMYHFIFLDETQQALEGKYVDKIDKKISKVIDEIYENRTTDEWKPKPSPLCYWCPYTGSSPLADDNFTGMCQYYSLWTPQNKTYATRRKWDANSPNNKRNAVDW